MKHVQGGIPIGEALLKVRNHRGLTQRQLMQKAGINANAYLSQVERGRISPTLNQLQRFAVALDVPLWKLVRHAQKLEAKHG